MEFNTLQELFGRGINPGTAGAVEVKRSVGSAAPRIPPSAGPVSVGRPLILLIQLLVLAVLVQFLHLKVCLILVI